MVCMYHIFSIHSSVAGDLDFFHDRMIVNNAAVNIVKHRVFLLMVSYSVDIYQAV